MNMVKKHPSSTNSNNNGRMILAISLTLLAFIIEIYNGNTRIVNLDILHNTFKSTTTTTIIPLASSLLPLLFVTLLTLQILHLKSKASKSSIPGLPTNPNANFLIGHYGSLVQPSSHVDIFKTYASPSGISALWGPGLKVCASILRADHVRLVLRHTSSRDFSNFIVRHGRKTLGKESLILIEGGSRWKSTRSVVQKAFTIGAIQSGRGAVGECAVSMVRWLMRMAEATTSSSSCGDDNNKNEQPNNGGGRCHDCGGHKTTIDTESGKTRHMVCLDVENFFKLFSLDVFGRVTMDYDFECLKKATAATNNNNKSSSNNKEETKTTCTCFTSPPEAAAFEYLERDIGIRAHPKHLINPFTQFYWMPTKHNREYQENLNLVNSLMEGVIGLKLDEFLMRVKKQKQLEEMEEDEQQDQQQNGGGDGDDDEVEDNIITMTLRSVIEQYYHQPKQEQKNHHHQLSRSSSTASNNNDNNTTSVSSCPFSSTTSNISSSSSRHFSSSYQEFISDMDIIPPIMTQSDRTQIITNVTQILHTLLVAGYETTAISLSYTMYCLSKHPRCQDRACEEARRVLSTLDANTTKFDEDALPYCKAIITESLRLHVPVIFTTRVASKNLVLDTDDEGGMVTIPKGTRIIINPTMVHLDERNFDRAEEFLPERWVRWENGGWVDRDFEKEKSAADSGGVGAANTPPPSLSDKYTKENAHADTISAANPQNFFAFSDGARNCIGRRLAIMESTIFVAVLFRDMCVDLAEKGYELVKERRFVILAPKTLPIAFWKRDG